jgi:Domain of unknown function (DUF4261)
MSTLEKFLAKTGAAPDNSAALQVLFSERMKLHAEAVTGSLRAYAPEMAEAVCELDAELSAQGSPVGIVTWGPHTIRLVGFDAPMPTQAVEQCLQPAHFGQDLKAQARAHQSHLLLYYAGQAADPLAQYVALAAVSAALHMHGALIVLNETAHTAFPCVALFKVQGNRTELLASMPLLMLYAGFVKIDVEGQRGTWMRTFGNHVFGLPDLALLGKSHAEGQSTFDMFSNLLGYLRSSGATFEPGHTAQIGEGKYLKFRAPEAAEYWLQGQAPVLVLEVISKSDINKR